MSGDTIDPPIVNVNTGWTIASLAVIVKVILFPVVANVVSNKLFELIVIPVIIGASKSLRTTSLKVVFCVVLASFPA